MKEDSSKQSEPCPHFDGTHENYLQFRNALLAWLQTTSTSCIQMMCNRGGFELPADFLLAHGNLELLLVNLCQDLSRVIAQPLLREQEPQL